MDEGSKNPNRAIAVAVSAGMAMAMAPSAVAGSKREPAPIVYAGQGGGAPVETRQAAPRADATKPASSASARAVPGPGGKRIEFRYPDQPETYYSEDGARADMASDPMVFSSSKAAIAPDQARQFAAAVAPVRSAPPPRDPAISPGGFDARAAAARVEANLAAQPRETEITAVAMPPVAAPAARRAAVAPAPRADGLPSGVAFQPAADPGLDERGPASWYGEELHGAPTANGEVFDMNGLTAAHPTLPLPSLVQVVNLENGRETVVRVNDRGPFEGGRIIEVSKAAAQALGFANVKEANVRVRYLGPAEVRSAATAQGDDHPPKPILADFESVDYAAAPPLAFEPRLPVPDPVGVESGQGYFVQLGSFADIANAQTLHAEVAGAMPVEIVPARVGGADYFRVFVGPVGNRSDAVALRDRLERSGVASGMVVQR